MARQVTPRLTYSSAAAQPQVGPRSHGNARCAVALGNPDPRARFRVQACEICTQQVTDLRQIGRLSNRTAFSKKTEISHVVIFIYWLILDQLVSGVTIFSYSILFYMTMMCDLK